MVCDANERTVGLVGVNTHDQQVCPLRQCRDGNPPRRNQGCIRPVSCPPVRRGWCLRPGRVSNDDLSPAFGAAPQPAGDRCHQGNAEDRHLPNKFDHQAGPTLGHGRLRDCCRSPNRCHTLSRPLQCVYCRITLYGIKRHLRRHGRWLSLSSYSPARSGRSRLLRAAWRPCSRGPARRAQWSMNTRLPQTTRICPAAAEAAPRPRVVLRIRNARTRASVSWHIVVAQVGVSAAVWSPSLIGRMVSTVAPARPGRSRGDPGTQRRGVPKCVHQGSGRQEDESRFQSSSRSVLAVLERRQSQGAAERSG